MITNHHVSPVESKKGVISVAGRRSMSAVILKKLLRDANVNSATEAPLNRLDLDRRSASTANKRQMYVAEKTFWQAIAEVPSQIGLLCGSGRGDYFIQ